MPAKTVLIALPNRDFDPSEVAVSWQLLRAAGHRVRFDGVLLGLRCGCG